MEQQLTEATETIEVDGYRVNPETGEVVGHAEHDEVWRPQTREEVEWVLERMAEADAEILALDARLAALKSNLEAQRKAQERRLAFLNMRFGADLEKYARESLQATGWKTKTLQLDNGRISFRTSRGTNKIVDMDAAVEWAEIYVPDIVKKSVNVTDIITETGDLTQLNFIESTPPSETVTITTGITQ